MGSGLDMYQLLVPFAAHRLDKTPPVQFAFRQTVLLTTSGLEHMPVDVGGVLHRRRAAAESGTDQSATMSVSPVRMGTA
jgi:hypothetical protein